MYRLNVGLGQAETRTVEQEARAQKRVARQMPRQPKRCNLRPGMNIVVDLQSIGRGTTRATILEAKKKGRRAVYLIRTENNEQLVIGCGVIQALIA